MSKYSILYADDDPDDLELVQEAFSLYSTNFNVTTFMDGGQILSYLQHLPEKEPTPCLVILDINMPVMTGKEVLINIRQIPRYESIPVVLFTTSSQPLDKIFASQYNAGFITKPIGMKEMDLIIKQFINHCSEEVKNFK
jgi:CheY-like chemotaxis protein